MSRESLLQGVALAIAVVVVLLAVIYLSGTAAPPVVDVPGTSRVTTTVTVVWEEDFTAIYDSWIEAGGEEPADNKYVAAWSIHSMPGGKCVIHALHPLATDGGWSHVSRLNSLGHELLHCTDGNWHE